MKNVNYLELQYGGVDWRPEVLVPAERFVDGTFEIPDRPGFGVALNQGRHSHPRPGGLRQVRQHRSTMSDLALVEFGHGP